MTKADFARKYRHKLAGMALYGIASETKDGPMARAAKVLDVPNEVDRLLELMWVDAQPVEAGNGQIAGKVGK